MRDEVRIRCTYIITNVDSVLFRNVALIEKFNKRQKQKTKDRKQKTKDKKTTDKKTDIHKDQEESFMLRCQSSFALLQDRESPGYPYGR